MNVIQLKRIIWNFTEIKAVDKMETVYKSIVLLIIGIFLTFLTYKANFLVEENCAIPEESCSIPNTNVIVDFSCIKSILIFLFLGFLTIFVFMKNILMITDAERGDKK